MDTPQNLWLVTRGLAMMPTILGSLAETLVKASGHLKYTDWSD